MTFFISFNSPPQVNPDKYKSIGNGFAVTVREDGVRGLAKGWAPTFIGYSMQGLCKFGFYEVFKVIYSDLLGEVSPDTIIISNKYYIFYLKCTTVQKQLDSYSPIFYVVSVSSLILSAADRYMVSLHHVTEAHI